jgi:hypothetical protein
MASSTWFIIPLHAAKSHNSKLIIYDLICQNIIFCSTLSEFENFLLCGRILINLTTCQNETSS